MARPQDPDHPVEMNAPIVTLETFAERVRISDLLLFVDSEVVESAWIKGYTLRKKTFVVC